MLKGQIQADSVQALKAKNQELLEVLRLLLAAISAKEKEKRYSMVKEGKELTEEQLQKEAQLSDEEVVATLSSEIKKRKDAIVLYEKGNRQELADKEKREIEILKKYLPEQIPADELKKMIEESLAKTGAKAMKDMGKVMADLMPKIKGKADTSEVSKMVKETLGNTF